MKVIDFIGLGVDGLIYVIIDGNSAPEKVVWRGTRQDFVRELSAFFLLFYRTVTMFNVSSGDVLLLYI